MMKNLLLGCLAIGTLFFTTNAQKDISVNWDAPSAGSTFEAGVDYTVDFTITNVGTDDLVAEDSVYFALTVGGNNLFGNLVLLAERTNGVVANGESWSISYPLEFSNIQQTATTDFCVVVFLYEGTATDPTVESDATNNQSCISANFVEGTNSLDEGFSILGYVNAYPNPATDVVNFEDKGAKAENIVLTDLSGKVIAETTFANGSASFDVSTLKAGMYLYTVKTATGELATERLTIK